MLVRPGSCAHYSHVPKVFFLLFFLFFFLFLKTNIPALKEQRSSTRVSSNRRSDTHIDDNLRIRENRIDIQDATSHEQPLGQSVLSDVCIKVIRFICFKTLRSEGPLAFRCLLHFR